MNSRSIMYRKLKSKYNALNSSLKSCQVSANMDVILRTTIPVELQGRVYACRNAFQFFTIPIGLFLGVFMVDHVCEPVMSEYGDLSILKTLFGMGKGSGVALMILFKGGNKSC